MRLVSPQRSTLFKSSELTQLHLRKHFRNNIHGSHRRNHALTSVGDADSLHFHASRPAYIVQHHSEISSSTTSLPSIHKSRTSYTGTPGHQK
jgi:hypothetical protein